MASLVSHSLKHISIGVTPGISFPEYTLVGLMDGEPFVYYDSNIRQMVPKAEWIEENEGTDYWSRETQIQRDFQEIFRTSVAVLMRRYNQTTGVHTFQSVIGCELDDDGTKRGYLRHGYDGEDFISLDLNTITWTAANAKAIITKQKWEVTPLLANFWKRYLDITCIEWIKKYIGYGRATLERKVPPEVILFQKDSTSPVVCHATGFFPKEVMISWQKNGVDLHENMELRETSPNQNGTFQKRSVLTVSPEELDKNEYTCVVQHSGLEKDLVLRVADRRVLNTGGALVGVIVGILVAVLLVLIGVGFFIWRKRNEKSSDFRPVARSDGESSSTSSNEGQPAKC
ncbi:BOLA class I histocompatibility antigen, alpha chain BL3-7-like [Electrophorus electricus]|uniref:BOLA class I histocompatibility antigen, alpha chain BL3-7-like n=1 Tax=Electrophorus electricus TaxID=8005 RepID=UPI0015D06D5C|nr:BOLA class I histocompatibility antigen, alpha chain BL3-7-like [Electrophorus electricus]